MTHLVTCDGCNSTTITGVRYKCLNCVAYDLCEKCESNNDHESTHVFAKIKMPLMHYGYHPETSLMHPHLLKDKLTGNDAIVLICDKCYEKRSLKK
jgi:ZZ type zinc finger protein